MAPGSLPIGLPVASMQCSARNHRMRPPNRRAPTHPADKTKPGATGRFGMGAHGRHIDRRRFCVTGFGAGLLALAGMLGAPARAETDFPNRPIRFFLPYGPGGVADVTMRLLAQKLTEMTKQQ